MEEGQVPALASPSPFPVVPINAANGFCKIVHLRRCTLAADRSLDMFIRIVQILLWGSWEADPNKNKAASLGSGSPPWGVWREVCPQDKAGDVRSGGGP